MMHRLTGLMALLMLAGCSTMPESYTGDYRDLTTEKAMADAMSKRGGIPNFVKLGKPYSIKGKTYTPRYDPFYDEVGIASWYGPGFHGSGTATGEEFNKHEFTAAHPVLPLPSLVRVTNLENGREIIVRVNDRGPFASNRIIDLSKYAADALGVTRGGTAKVRVKYLDKESWQLWQQLALNVPSGMQPPVDPAIAALEERSGDRAVQQLSLASVESRELDGSLALIPQAAPPLPEAMTAPAAGAPVMGSLSAPLPPAEPGVFVQAGAFSSQQNAEAAAQRLSPLGTAVMQPVVRGETTFYRVRVGPVASGVEAQQLREKLTALGFTGASVVGPGL